MRLGSFNDLVEKYIREPLDVMLVGSATFLLGASLYLASSHLEAKARARQEVLICARASEERIEREGKTIEANQFWNYGGRAISLAGFGLFALGAMYNRFNEQNTR